MFKGAHLAHSTSDGKIWSINTPNSSGAFSFGSMLKLIGSNWLAQGSDTRLGNSFFFLHTYTLSEHSGSEGAGLLSLISHRGFCWSQNFSE